MHRTVAAALVAALALGVASCGGSEETLTRAELTSRIETACREAQKIAQKKMRASARSSEGNSSFLVGILTAQRTLMQRIEDLNPSDAQKANFAAYKRAIQQRTAMFARLDGLSDDALARATSSMQAEAEAVTRRVTAASQRLGVRNCI
jgi:hypothetical protein